MYHIAVSLFLTGHIIHISHIACWHSLCRFIQRARRLSVRAMWNPFCRARCSPRVTSNRGGMGTFMKKWTATYRKWFTTKATQKKIESRHIKQRPEMCVLAQCSAENIKRTAHISPLLDLLIRMKRVLFIHQLFALLVCLLGIMRRRKAASENFCSPKKKMRRKKSTHDSGDMANEFVRI